VATDVAARGLDLPDLGLVIHAELPVNRAGLLHRSGRTGRAGRTGVSVLLVPYPRRRKAEQLLDSARIEATWSSPPTAEEIRAKDQVRLLDDPLLAETPAEDELALGRLLLEKRSAEEVAAALIRLYRSRLPAAEDLLDASPGPAPLGRYERPERGPRYEREDRGDRPERGERKPWEGPADTAWFRLAVGRSTDADPKWLIPLICRMGHVTKADIGAIRIFDRETKFEITREAEARFAAAVASTPPEERMRIERAGAPAARRDERPPHAAKSGKPNKPFRAGKPERPANKGKPNKSHHPRP
jgi:ATP-dependent RNA helicase DeaD